MKKIKCKLCDKEHRTEDCPDQLDLNLEAQQAVGEVLAPFCNEIEISARLKSEA